QIGTSLQSGHTCSLLKGMYCIIYADINSPSTLAANATCTINVTFTPAATGSRSATLTVTDNASNSPQTAGVSGTGTAPPSLSPTSLAFSNQNVGATSGTQAVTLSNPTSTALTITSIGFTGTNPG